MSLISNPWSPAFRPRLALGLLFAFCVASLLGAALTLSKRLAAPWPDEETIDERAPAAAVVYEQRFAGLAEIASPGLVAGYVTDKLGAGGFTDPIALQEFFLAQYAVAPIILVRGTEPDLVIANFPDLGDPDAARRMVILIDRLGLLRDYGDGVLLLGEPER